MQQITSKTSGKVFYFPTSEEVEEADAEMSGFCLACGEVAKRARVAIRKAEGE